MALLVVVCAVLVSSALLAELLLVLVALGESLAVSEGVHPERASARTAVVAMVVKRFTSRILSAVHGE